MPEFPFSGEVEASNLLLALDNFQAGKEIGWVSPLHNVTVVTPNDRLVSNSALLNDFYVRKLENYGATIMYGTKLLSIDKGRADQMSWSALCRTRPRARSRAWSFGTCTPSCPAPRTPC